MRPGGTCLAHSRSVRGSLFSSRDAEGTLHAARCMWLRSTLREQSQRTAMATAARCVFGSKMLGGFSRHGGVLCSRRSASVPRTVRGQMHHIPLLRKTARDIRENCCALLRACKGPLGEPDAPFPRTRNVLVPNGLPRITCRQSAAGTVLCPTIPAVQQPSAYSKPSSCLRSWGGGKRASYGGVDMPLMLRAQRPRRLRSAPRRSRSRRSPPAGHTTE